MKKARNKLWQAGVVCILMIILPFYAFAPFNTLATQALDNEYNSAKYCDDGVINDEGITPYGEGASYNDNQDIYYDYKIVTDNHLVGTAPSYGNGDPSMTDVCAPMAGTNSIAYYDRWFTNLIPNFNPGMMNGNSYQYFPDLGFPATENLVKSLYSLMKTNVGLPGTSGADFKSGLTTYATQKGYTLSYSNFRLNSKNVNLTTFANAISNNKVGFLLCDTYNFIYSINNNSNGVQTMLAKRNSTIGHMMMAYGYQIIAYYKNGVNFRTDTYLQVCSGYGTADHGYILMNEFLTLNEALIVTVV